MRKIKNKIRKIFSSKRLCRDTLWIIAILRHTNMYTVVKNVQVENYRDEVADVWKEEVSRKNKSSD